MKFVDRNEPPHRSEDVRELVEQDVASMLKANYKCTLGDIACLQAGHIAGQTVRDLIHGWDKTVPTVDRIATVTAHMADLVTAATRRVVVVVG